MLRGLLILFVLLTVGLVGWIVFSESTADDPAHMAEGIAATDPVTASSGLAEAVGESNSLSTRKEVPSQTPATPRSDLPVLPAIGNPILDGMPHQLSGRVHVDGNGVAEATVLAYKSLGGGLRVPKSKPLARTKSDQNGNFEMTTPGGRVDLVAFSGEFGPKDYLVVGKDSATEIGDLELELFPLQEIRGEVLADGVLVADASLKVRLDDYWQRSRAAEQPGIAYRALPEFLLQSGSNGEFSKRVPAGIYNVKADHQEFGKGQVPDVEAGSGRIVVKLKAQLAEAGNSISGIVLDQAGAPVSGADVWFAPQGPKTTTSSDGLFELRRIKKHWIAEPEVIAWAQGHAPGSGKFEMNPKGNAPIQVVLPAALEITGVLLDADGAPIPDGLIQLSGDRVFQSGSSPAPTLLSIFYHPASNEPLNEARTNSQGEFRFAHLPEGHFAFSYANETPSWNTDRRALAMAEADAGTQGLVLQVGKYQDLEAIFEGVVRHRHSGVPIEGAKVTANLLRRMGEGGWTANGVADATTDANGHFQIDGLAEGEYYLSIHADGFADNKGEPIEYQPGVHVLDFEMVPERQLNLLVLDAKGNPMSKVQILVKNEKGQGIMIKQGSGSASSPAPTDAHGKIAMHGMPGERISVGVLQDWNQVCTQEFDLSLPGPHEGEIRLSTVQPVDPRSVVLSFVDEQGARGKGISDEPQRALNVKAFDLDGYLVYQGKLWRSDDEWMCKVAEGRVVTKKSCVLLIKVPGAGARIEIDAYGFQPEVLHVPPLHEDDPERLKLTAVLRAN